MMDRSVMPEHDFEPAPGLPGALPKGERILWQGAPAPVALAKRAFHVNKIVAYAAIVLAAQAIFTLHDGGTPALALANAVPGAVGVASGLALLFAIAALGARTTLYTLTDRRLVMRIGMAFSMSINIPLKKVARADVRLAKDGSGDIALGLAGNERIAYLHLWPHARPWRFARPEPSLRAIPDAAKVAGMLGEALQAVHPAGGASVEAPVRGRDEAPLGIAA